MRRTKANRACNSTRSWLMCRSPGPQSSNHSPATICMTLPLSNLFVTSLEHAVAPPMCSGKRGPYSARKAYDMLIQAETGLASVTGSAAEPARVGVSVCDIAAGMNAYEAILEALIGRERNGKGAVLSVAMFDAMADWMTVP